MVPTQYGNVPDVAFEEIKAYTAQQQQSGSIALPTVSFVSGINNPTNSSMTFSDTISNSARPTARDLLGHNSSVLARSRSLASHSTARPTVAAVSTYGNNSTYQTPLFPTNKPAFQTPTRYGINRALSNSTQHNNALPSGSYTSSPTYNHHRSIPLGVPANIKHRYPTHYHPHSHHHSTNSVNNSAAATPNHDQQRPRYDTTYRTSFIKPLSP